MIEAPGHVGELNLLLFPYYALTNCVAAWRAWQLPEINLILRLWFVVGLVGGAYGHFRDLTQVLKGRHNFLLVIFKAKSGKLPLTFTGDKRFHQDVVKATKKDKVFGLCFLLFPSLLGVYAIEHLYVTNISGWGTTETNTLALLLIFCIGFDFYYTSQWDTSFFWHKTHVLGHLTFLITEYSALGYLQGWLGQFILSLFLH